MGNNQPITPECPNHVIKSGSTLSTIAQEYVAKGYSITWQEICEFNGIENCNVISTNEVIIIPVGKCKDAGKDTGSKPGSGSGNSGRQPGGGSGSGNSGSQPGGGSGSGNSTGANPGKGFQGGHVFVDGSVAAAMTVSAGALVLVHMLS